VRCVDAAELTTEKDAGGYAIEAAVRSSSMAFVSFVLVVEEFCRGRTTAAESHHTLLKCGASCVTDRGRCPSRSPAAATEEPLWIRPDARF
jgi:hypothetical protein